MRRISIPLLLLVVILPIAQVGTDVRSVSEVTGGRRSVSEVAAGPEVDGEMLKGRSQRVAEARRRGLEWLASQQQANGSWTGTSGHKRGDSYVAFNEEAWQRAHDQGHPGVTSLAGLAFLASGSVPGRGPHGEVVTRTMDYILRCAGHHDYIVDGGSRMYGHAFAVLFLSQIYGMTLDRSPRVKNQLMKSCEFIVKAQNGYGAWRYTPSLQEADLSVTVCQVQALRAARNTGVRVPKATIDRVIKYVELSRIERGRNEGAFYYKIYGRAARTKTSYAVNAAAVTTLHSSGVYDPKLYAGALDYLQRHYDEVSQYYPDHFYYWYGNYYAVQAFRMEGGKSWDWYWKRISDDLLRRQTEEGYWENSEGPGRNFSTAVACLILSAPLGYLPIFSN